MLFDKRQIPWHAGLLLPARKIRWIIACSRQSNELDCWSCTNWQISVSYSYCVCLPILSPFIRILFDSTHAFRVNPIPPLIILKKSLMDIIGTLTQATMTRRTNFLWNANIHLFLLCPRSVYLFDTSEGQNNEVVAWNHGWLMSSEWQIGRVDIHTDLLLSSPPFTLLFHSLPLPLLLAIYLSDRNIVGPRREANGVPRYNSSIPYIILFLLCSSSFLLFFADSDKVLIRLSGARTLLQLGRIEEARKRYEEAVDDPERGSEATLGLAKVTSGGGGEEVNWRRLSFFFRCMSHTWMKMPNLCHFISKYFSSIF